MAIDQAASPTSYDEERGVAAFAGRTLRPLSPILALYLVYTAIRFLLSDRGPLVGLTNAEILIDLEARLGIDWELGIQSFALDRHWLIVAANWYYVAGFLPVLVAGAVLAAWRAPAAFAWWRTVFAASLFIALIGYASYPLMPPRLMPSDWGFVDTLQLHGPHYYGDADGKSLFNAYGSLPNMVNVYAAMPSMHVAWSAIAGALLAAGARNRRSVVAFAILHPVAMGFAVVATGNHFLLDIVAGLAVLALAIAAAWLIERWRARIAERARDG